MRGSTHGREGARLGSRVYPAHAGIDRSHHAIAPGHRGLPRACGDRPFVRFQNSPNPRSTPRMRGSTFPICERASVTVVYPAHAGIDPGGCRRPVGDRGLPRACGDRPCRSDDHESAAMSTPRMRGSTRKRGVGAGACRVYPAHAGIDPQGEGRACAPRCLPRACGDRPYEVSQGHVSIPSTPRMRGSTPRRPARRRWWRVYPAHAGIDPERFGPLNIPTRLPRACGDRPQSSSGGGSQAQSTPRMRGSTRGRHRARVRLLVYPAHAGIDPHVIPTYDRGNCLPRACGDRPHFRRRRALTTLSTPRMRGSTPEKAREALQWASTPRMRGSTF